MAFIDTSEDADGGTGRLAPGGSDRSLNDLVRDALRDEILTGKLKPGDRLVEGKLATRFRVSRNPVREALKALSNEGVVTIAPRRGAIVAELSDSEAAEVIELRAALEGLSAKLAARRLCPDTSDTLRKVLDEGETAAARADRMALARLNETFHAQLAAAGSNRFLADFMRTLRTKTQWLFADVTRDRAEESWKEHAQILKAVLDRDEELAALVASRHVTRVGSDMMAGRAASPPSGKDTANDAE